MLKTIYLIFLGLTSGCMVAAGTFAFIAAIGIVPAHGKADGNTAVHPRL